MKVLSQLDSNHTITLIPRFTPTLDLTFNLRNESTNVTELIANTYTNLDGFTYLSFDYDFTGGYKYSFKVLENENVVYMGKIFITESNPQDYKQTTGLYIYE